MPLPGLDDVPPCHFCGARGILLCDGKLPDGKVCLKRICGEHAFVVAYKGPHGRGGCGADTKDLCYHCMKAGRSAA